MNEEDIDPDLSLYLSTDRASSNPVRGELRFQLAEDTAVELWDQDASGRWHQVGAERAVL